MARPHKGTDIQQGRNLSYIVSEETINEHAMIHTAHLPYSRIMGVTTCAQEGSLDSTEFYCTLDFAYMGMFPDVLAKWHERNSKHTPSDVLTNAWHCIEALLLLRAETMQCLIRRQLELQDKQLQQTYPRPNQTLNPQTRPQRRYSATAPSHTYTEFTDDLNPTDPTHPPTLATTAADTRTHRQTRNFPCRGVTCRWKRHNGKPLHRSRIPSKNANCETCRLYHRATTLANTIEMTLRNDMPTLLQGTHTVTNSTETSRLETLRSWIRDIIPDPTQWPKITRNTRGHIQNTKVKDEQNRVIRAVAKTLDITLPGKGIRGTDGSYSTTERNLITTKSQITCNGTCTQRAPQATIPRTTQTYPHPLCPLCGYLRTTPEHHNDPTRCPCCDQPHPAHSKNTTDTAITPCIRCRWTWLLQKHHTKGHQEQIDHDLNPEDDIIPHEDDTQLLISPSAMQGIESTNPQGRLENMTPRHTEAIMHLRETTVAHTKDKRKQHQQPQMQPKTKCRRKKSKCNKRQHTATSHTPTNQATDNRKPPPDQNTTATHHEDN